MESTETLVDYLCEVPDFRRAEGRRYPLPAVLIMIIMAIMSGHYGYREMARFLRANRSALVARLGLDREQMPSHVTLRTILQEVDFTELNGAFRRWATTHLNAEDPDWVAIDAKAIGSTVSDYARPYQDFVSLVSAFSHRQGLVLATGRYSNKEGSEPASTEQVITELVETLDLQGVTLSLDALHCKKK